MSIGPSCRVAFLSRALAAIVWVLPAGCAEPAGSVDRLAQLLSDPRVVEGVEWALDSYLALEEWPVPPYDHCLVISGAFSSVSAEERWTDTPAFDLTGSLEFGGCYTVDTSDGTRVGPCSGVLSWEQEGGNVLQSNQGEASGGQGDGWAWAEKDEYTGRIADGTIDGRFYVVQYNQASNGVCSQTVVNLLQLAANHTTVKPGYGCVLNVVLESDCAAPEYLLSTFEVDAFTP